MLQQKLVVSVLNKHKQRDSWFLVKPWNCSANFWERRLSLFLVEWYTRIDSLHPAIEKLIKPLENDEEYYVKKAVVWIRKNFAKGK